MPSKEEVANFIRSTFRSVWALELLCFLRRHEGQSLTTAEMVAGLRGSELIVTRSVEALTAAGLLLRDAEGSARYAPASRDLAELVEGTESLYLSSPDGVRRMIVAAANPGVTAFADSFRLRKD